jgi:RimJ/RimL family protein N-acetyltransferase
LYDSINSETDFMLLEAGELQVSVSDQAKFFQESASARSGVTLLAESERQPVGLAFARRNSGRRQAHTLYLGIGVLQAWVGRGIGSRLMLAMEHWALSRDFHRLELVVHVENARAIALYERLGYEREGVRKHGFKIDGKYVDLFYMVKLIGG